MPISQSDIKCYKSESGNISATELLGLENELFDDVSGDEALGGSVSYKKVYVKNVSLDSSLLSGLVYIPASSTSPDDEIYISGCNSLTGDNPTGDGQLYVHPTSGDSPQAISLGDLAPGEYKPIWVKRVVESQAPEFSNNTSIIGVSGSNQVV